MASRKDDIELRLKVICTSEIRSSRLKVEIQQKDGEGVAQNTTKLHVCGATEMDCKVPIFLELERKNRSEAETHLSWSIAINLPKHNLNKGALLIEQLELYIHDTK